MSDAQTTRLVAALRRQLAHNEGTLKDLGGCDHSVGICYCDIIRDVAEAQDVIREIEEACVHDWGFVAEDPVGHTADFQCENCGKRQTVVGPEAPVVRLLQEWVDKLPNIIISGGSVDNLTYRSRAVIRKAIEDRAAFEKAPVTIVMNVQPGD